MSCASADLELHTLPSRGRLRPRGNLTYYVHLLAPTIYRGTEAGGPAVIHELTNELLQPPCPRRKNLYLTSSREGHRSDNHAFLFESCLMCPTHRLWSSIRDSSAKASRFRDSEKWSFSTGWQTFRMSSSVPWTGLLTRMAELRRSELIRKCRVVCILTTKPEVYFLVASPSNHHCGR